MNYILTGVRGFIASEIARQLLKDPSNTVWGVDDDSKGYGDRNLLDIINNPKLKIFKIDISKPTEDELFLLDGLISMSDYVISAASKIGGIGYFNKIPATIIRDNNLINTTLLDLIVASTKRPRFVYLSSSMVYEAAVSFPSRETDLETTFIPKTAYGMSKLCGEYFCKAYAKQYGLHYTIVRPFNAIGPERPDPNMVGFSHVLPDLVLKIHNGQGTEHNPLEILGTGDQVRHYTHVRDIADGILTCIHSAGSLNNDFNISTPYGHSVKDLALILWDKFREKELKTLNKTDKKTLYCKSVQGFDADVQNRVPDTSKMYKHFGWQAKYTLEDSAEEVIDAVIKLL